jgi:hypothetical protein
VPRNSNPWVRALLDWHGYGIGGVRVPFRSAGRPSGGTIRTPVIDRLDELATDLAAGASTPRWIFLVGGPGNGKSEAVEAFIKALDSAFDGGGALTTLARTKFTATTGVARRIELLASELDGQLGANFEGSIGRLVIVQDASAMDTQGDSGQALVDDLVELSPIEPNRSPIYLCCVNRGVLADACRRAYQGGPNSRTFTTLRSVIEATAFRLGTYSGPRPTCWPLADGRVACWPLDVSSLFEVVAGAAPPGDVLFAQATTADKWESPGRCTDCDARALCPFRENAARLRDSAVRGSLVRIVRRGELASGERLNFRAALSLVAESIVGDWPDFAGLRDPCEWVHEQVDWATAQPPNSLDALRAELRLLFRLTPHAIFREFGSLALAAEIQGDASDRNRATTTGLLSEANRVFGSGNSSLRNSTLPQVLSPLDPAWYSPEKYSPGDPKTDLRRVEDAYSQGMTSGNAVYASEVSTIELQVLQSIELAEREWASPTASEARAARRAQRWLRGWASALVKRSIAIRTGQHMFEGYLADYESGLRVMGRLQGYIEQPLRSIVGRSTFQFGVMETFGRAVHKDVSSLLLHSGSPGITLTPAPSADQHSPAHDFPVLYLDNHGIPLTFEVFLALRLQGAGCTSSSLPPGVRAAIDRVRQLRAGRACRDRSDLVSGRAWIELGELGRISIDPSSGSPVYSRQGG